MKKVLWVKFGWSEYYRGGQVDGNFGWLNEGKGGEAFNFMRQRGGNYYCYVPPQAKVHPPWNEDNTGWTVVCLAKKPKLTGIHIVGWYEDATLLGEWKKSPSKAHDWSYCIKSKSAFLIPPEQRNAPFSHPSVGQGKFSFLVGPDIESKPNKKRVLTILEGRLAKLRDVAVHNPTEESAPDPELDPVDPLKGFGTPEHRKKVEKAAEKAVIAHYKAKEFKFKNKTKVSCGYDFLFWKESRKLHVEIKGTSSENAGFFLTRNEHDRCEIDSAWRLAMVTRALSEKPVVEIYDPKALRKTFEITPYVFLGRPVVKPENA